MAARCTAGWRAARAYRESGDEAANALRIARERRGRTHVHGRVSERDH